MDVNDLLESIIAAIRDLGDELLRHEIAIEARLDGLIATLPLRDLPVGGTDRVSVGTLEPNTHPAPAPPFGTPATSDVAGQRRTLVAFFLQPFRVYLDYVPVVAWRGEQSQTLLRYLLTRHPIPVSRDELMETFWPDCEPVAARRCVHQAVYRLRRMLQSHGSTDLIVFEHGSYAIDHDVDVWTDATEFERLIVKGASSERTGDVLQALAYLSTAETLYHDDYMQDRPYDDWCRERRETLHRVYIDTVAHMAETTAGHGDHATTIQLCQRLLAREPTNEAIYLRLMQSHLAQGQRHLAAIVYRQCELALRDQLGIQPNAAVTRLFAQIDA